jgi:hypothetical protein
MYRKPAGRVNAGFNSPILKEKLIRFWFNGAPERRALRASDSIEPTRW